MFNYYLFNESYQTANAGVIEANLQDLNDLVIDQKEETDSFLKHESIWGAPTIDGNFAEVVFSKLEDKQFSMTVLPRMFRAINSIEPQISTLQQFDESYKMYNAFYGVAFTGMDLTRCITDKITYNEFRINHLFQVTPETFWERRELLFSKLILCSGIENDVKKIGGAYLEQILVELVALDDYVVKYWKDKIFSYKDANEKTTLNISPESKKTMDQEKYFNQRVFSLPDGRKECFELHIKSGDLRFHFFPENQKIYIGYIGKHLDTDKY